MPRGMLYGGSYDAIAGQELNRDQARDSRYFQSLAAQRALEEMQFRQQQAMAAQRMQQMEMAQRIREHRLQTLLANQRHQENRGDSLRDLLLRNSQFNSRLGLDREALGLKQDTADTRNADFEQQQAEDDLFSQQGADSATQELRLQEQARRAPLMAALTGADRARQEASRPRMFMPDAPLQSDRRLPRIGSREILNALKAYPDVRQRYIDTTGKEPETDLFRSDELLGSQIKLGPLELSNLLTAIRKSRSDIRYDESSERFVPVLPKRAAKQPAVSFSDTYARIPKGTRYLDPNGVERIKR